jgi:CheY-like chemotaxis protein
MTELQRVLVVDDDAASRSAVVACLDGLGVELH